MHRDQLSDSNVVRLSVVFVVILLLVTAGCSGLDTGSDRPDREPYGVDDVYTPADQNETEDENESVTWFETAELDGIEDANAIHHDVLENRSYWKYTEVNETIETESAYIHLEQWAQVNQNRTERYVIERYDGDWLEERPETGSHVELVAEYPGTPDTDMVSGESWEDETDFVYRSEWDNGSVTYTATKDDILRFSTERRLLGTLSIIQADNITVTESTDGSYFVINATQPPAELNVRPEKPFSLELMVRNDGLIMQGSIEATIDTPNENRTIYEEFGVFEIGTVSALDRPDWYDEVPDEREGGTESESQTIRSDIGQSAIEFS